MVAISLKAFTEKNHKVFKRHASILFKTHKFNIIFFQEKVTVCTTIKAHSEAQITLSISKVMFH